MKKKKSLSLENHPTKIIVDRFFAAKSNCSQLQRVTIVLI